jgi:hypothetical protein
VKGHGRVLFLVIENREPRLGWTECKRRHGERDIERRCWVEFVGRGAQLTPIMHTLPADGVPVGGVLKKGMWREKRQLARLVLPSREYISLSLSDGHLTDGYCR